MKYLVKMLVAAVVATTLIARPAVAAEKPLKVSEAVAALETPSGRTYPVALYVQGLMDGAYTTFILSRARGGLSLADATALARTNCPDRSSGYEILKLANEHGRGELWVMAVIPTLYYKACTSNDTDT